MDIEQQIFKKSSDLFLRYGIRSITMDEVARELGMSKKTLYQYVENKADLINKVVLQFMTDEMATIVEIHNNAEDAIHEMILNARHATQHLRKLRPTTVYDLKKYYRKSWELIEQMHYKNMHEVIKANLEKGIAEGVYRANINPLIIARFHVNQTSVIVDEDIFPLKDFNKEELLEEFVHYHIRGIASEKGLQLLEKHIN